MSDFSEKSDTESATPGRCRTPDSMFSANSGYMSMTGSSTNNYYKMPEKLRIVKPLEGRPKYRDKLTYMDKSFLFLFMSSSVSKKKLNYLL